MTLQEALEEFHLEASPWCHLGTKTLKRLRNALWIAWLVGCSVTFSLETRKKSMKNCCLQLSLFVVVNKLPFTTRLIPSFSQSRQVKDWGRNYAHPIKVNISGLVKRVVSNFFCSCSSISWTISAFETWLKMFESMCSTRIALKSLSEPYIGGQLLGTFFWGILENLPRCCRSLAAPAGVLTVLKCCPAMSRNEKEKKHSVMIDHFLIQVLSRLYIMWLFDRMHLGDWTPSAFESSRVAPWAVRGNTVISPQVGQRNVWLRCH